MKVFLIVLVVIVVLLAICLISTYNGLVQKRNRVRGQFAQVDVILQNRADLIPNLVETVKGYASHEKETFEEVIKARNSAISATTIEEKAAADQQITGAIGRLMVVAESYPELKASVVFEQLQKELANTEERIRFARQFYNDAVLKYHQDLDVFPTNILGGILGFRHEPFFEASSRETPKVSF